MTKKDPSIDLPETYDRQPIEVNLPPPPPKKTPENESLEKSKRGQRGSQSEAARRYYRRSNFHIDSQFFRGLGDAVLRMAEQSDRDRRPRHSRRGKGRNFPN